MRSVDTRRGAARPVSKRDLGDPSSLDTAVPGSAGASRARSRERRGLAWVIGSFVLCPCHLPLTLALLSTVAGGTAFGALLHEHIVLAGSVIVAVWAFGFWRGLRLLRQPAACAIPGTRRSGSEVVRDFVGLTPKSQGATRR